MRLLKVTMFDPRATDEARSLRLLDRRSGKAGEALLGIRDNHVVIHRTGRTNHHAWASVVALEIGAQCCASEVSQGLRRAKQRTPHGLFRECKLTQIFVDHIVRSVADRADLLLNHALLALYI